MARTKNPTKRARVQGESASASPHYMAKWLTQPAALHKYVEDFETMLIVPPRYIEVDYIVEKNFKVLQSALETRNLIEFVGIDDDYYPNLVKAVYSTLKYVVDGSSDEEEDEEVIPRIDFDLGNRHYRGCNQTEGLGYACQWTRIFKWLRIDLDGEKKVSMKSHNKIDDVTLKHMRRNPDYNQDQAPVVEKQPRPHPPPTMRDVLDELHSQRLYMEGKFAEMSKSQDEIRQDQNRQWQTIDRICTSLAIPNPKDINPMPADDEH
ncbi:hypothetical protein PIB30_029628 [Stylosanthes scabra]|uniref:Uncharacterized protein n=1 Tax=Stylosanthes scabra TaxID=79078 RepID=A0ABU6RBK1_9FABA|nr:hypothetical protein [Stylosanthes scabra]